jgi:hypothetical protein
MMETLLVLLAALLAASCLAMAFSPWLLAAALTFLALLLASLQWRRSGLLVAAAVAGAVTLLAAALSGSESRLWQALALGVGYLVLLDASWDRITTVRARIGLREYARRLAYLGSCSCVAGAAILVAATLGTGAARYLRAGFPLPVALAIAAAAAGALALAVAGVLKRRRRELDRPDRSVTPQRSDAATPERRV